MVLIGMPEAARRAGVNRSSIKRALENDGYELVQINERAFAIDDNKLAAFIGRRGSSPGAGRPVGAKNKLPDGMLTNDLEANGYNVVEDKHAKHVRYNSHRWQCDFCGKWFKQLSNRKCMECQRKSW